MTGADLLSIILVFAVACPTSVTPLASTVSPQESYSRFLQSLAGQKLASTRAPTQDVSSFPAGSYESALQAGTFFLKYPTITAASWNVLKEHICYINF